MTPDLFSQPEPQGRPCPAQKGVRCDCPVGECRIAGILDATPMLHVESQPSLTAGEDAILRGVQADRERRLQARKRRVKAPDATTSISARFDRFHADNPHVYDRLVGLARQVRNRGMKQWSIQAAFEVLRYQALTTDTAEPFKLSDNFRSRYARLIMDREPDLRGFFKTKELRSL